MKEHSLAEVMTTGTQSGAAVISSNIEGAFQINPGLNDVWFNGNTAGQGFTVTVFPDLQGMFVVWFTFDTFTPEPCVSSRIGYAGHRWLSAFGFYDGDQANLDIEFSRDGIFNDAFTPVNQSLGGTMTVQFDDCNNGTVTYDIPSIGVMGSIPVQRIAPDNIAFCEAF
jgi:hypothetical protein